MTFSTSKRKIFSMWNDSIQNQFVIDGLSSNNQIILNKTNELNRTDTIYNNVVDFSNDWIVPITVLTRDSINDPREVIISISAEHSVIFNGMHTSLMPYIQSKVSYRLGDSQISVPIPTDGEGSEFDDNSNFFDGFRVNSIIEIAPIINEDGETTEGNTITYRTSVFATFAVVEGGTGFPPEIQLKFFVSIVNPMYYQST